MLRTVIDVLFPAPKMRGCNPLSPAERLALWERRRGEHLARKALQRDRVRKYLDLRLARSIRRTA
ncbi:MAG: hypothetical protein KAX77_05525 [Xanthomonadales bacterium]|nr:hypothetical protein [Xanthomonadales bacterium]